MRRKIGCLLAGALGWSWLIGAVAGETTKKSTAPSKKTAPAKAFHSAKAPVKSSAAGKGTATHKAAAKGYSKSSAKGATKAGPAKGHTTTSRNRRKQTVASFRAGQQAPAPDRVKEIQSALIDKGYLQGTADGAWTPGTIDALKRFQQDQNLTADGKLNSLSIIALGLGPKRNGIAAVRPPEPKKETQ
jgi:peptidoglycan hydrolase-like protein with peptidoglycan-binding domain